MPGVRQSLGCGRVPEQGMPNLSPRHSPANLMSFQDLCLPRLAHARPGMLIGQGALQEGIPGAHFHRRTRWLFERLPR